MENVLNYLEGKDILSFINKNAEDGKFLDLQEKFFEIAKCLFNNYHIQKGMDSYELMEIEFYVYTTKHKDIITYKRYSDKPGMWFFHMSGMDITFGSEKIKDQMEGGILIRSILKRGDDNNPIPISGPINCEDELFSYIDALNEKASVPHLEANSTDYQSLINKDTFEIKRTQRFIPFRVKKSEQKEKVLSKLKDIVKNRGCEDMDPKLFEDYLTAHYRFYWDFKNTNERIEKWKKYWSDTYQARPWTDKTYLIDKE